MTAATHIILGLKFNSVESSRINISARTNNYVSFIPKFLQVRTWWHQYMNTKAQSKFNANMRSWNGIKCAKFIRQVEIIEILFDAKNILIGVRQSGSKFKKSVINFEKVQRPLFLFRSIFISRAFMQSQRNSESILKHAKCDSIVREGDTSKVWPRGK